MEKILCDKEVTRVSFQWARAGDAYIIRGPQVIHKGGGVSPYRPVVGDLAIYPDNGKLVYEIRTNTDACKLGLCTATAFCTDSDLQEVELGKQRPTSTQGKAPDADNCWMFNCQTSTVEVNGEERKRLWRLFVPISGARFGFVIDTNEGFVQLYVNGEYQGIVFNTSLGLKGKTLYPCIGLEGMDMNNRNIAAGNKGAVVTSVNEIPVYSFV